MKTSIFFLASFIFFSSIGFKPSPAFEPVAVIELFTSQGCSSCPPADQLLSKTIGDAQKNGRKIFALEFHVDYWNRLGWADPFSDGKYSDRQSEYANHLGSSIYTPQMVVNGTVQFVGSDENNLHDALQKALGTHSAAAFKNLIVTQQNGKPMHVHYELEGEYANCNVQIALVSLSETTSVKRGENGGRTLKNENIVRQFISVKAAGSGETDFVLSPVPIPGNMAVIVFIQHNNDLRILGAASAALK